MTSCLQACVSCCGCEPAAEECAQKTFEDRATRTMRHLLTNRTPVYPREEQLEMDFTYLTERLIALSFPSVDDDSNYKKSLKQVLAMVKLKYDDHFLLVNLSEKRSEISTLCRQIVELGWPSDLAMPLENIYKLCQITDRWLSLSEKNVAVLHCKGGRGRLAVAVLSYKYFCTARRNGIQQVDAFALRRFYEDKLSLVTNPSQRRYIRYTRDVLAGALTVHTNALYLHAIILYGIPNFNGKGGAKLFFKIYRELICIHATDILVVEQDVQSLCVPLQPPLQLRGDVLLCCYHKAMQGSKRDVVFRCQFHTCEISSHERTFNKLQLDEANYDVRFPNDGRLELAFSWTGDPTIMFDRCTFRNANQLQATSTLADTHSQDPIVRWDSFENFNKAPSSPALHAADSTSMHSVFDNVDAFQRDVGRNALAADTNAVAGIDRNGLAVIG